MDDAYSAFDLPLALHVLHRADYRSSMIVPVFLPHFGCHDHCIYCDQDIITDAGEETLRDRIDHSLSGHQGPFEVGLYGGNIFGIKPEALWRIFSFFEDYGDRITNFRISTKPVPLDDEIIGLCKKNRVTVIELGIPSFNNSILVALNRKHSAEDLQNAFHRLSYDGFQVALQVMVGLPNEAMVDIRETVANITRLNPAYIRIYPLAFINGTPLADMYMAKKFIPIPFDEAVYRAMFIYLKAMQQNITTVKMGLTDNEIIQDRIIGGFYHPAFGFLVKSEAFYRAVMTKVIAGRFTGEVIVSLNQRDIPHLLGYKRAHLNRFSAAGISVTWQVVDIPPGMFMIKSKGKEANGDMHDALFHIN